MMTDSRHRDLRLYWRLVRMAKPYWAHIAGIGLLSLLATPLALLTPLPLKIAVDSAIDSRPLPRLLRVLGPPSHTSALLLAVGLMLAIALVSQLQSLAISLLRTYTGERLLLEFRSEIFRHMQRLSLLFHDTQGSAESLYRIQNDATSIQSIAIDNAIPFISAAFTVVGMLYVTVRMAWQLALVALVISPILFVVGRRYRRGLRSGAQGLKYMYTGRELANHMPSVANHAQRSSV